MTLSVGLRDAVLEALRESKGQASEAVGRQRSSNVYPVERTSKVLVELERADLFVRALERLGYEVRER